MPCVLCPGHGRLLCPLFLLFAASGPELGLVYVLSGAPAENPDEWGRMGSAWGWHGVGVGMGLACWGWHGVSMGPHGVGMGLAWGWHGVYQLEPIGLPID
jgi:hypothetical protein